MLSMTALSSEYDLTLSLLSTTLSSQEQRISVCVAEFTYCTSSIFESSVCICTSCMIVDGIGFLCFFFFLVLTRFFITSVSVLDERNTTGGESRMHITHRTISLHSIPINVILVIFDHGNNRIRKSNMTHSFSALCRAILGSSFARDVGMKVQRRTTRESVMMLVTLRFVIPGVFEWRGRRGFDCMSNGDVRTWREIDILILLRLRQFVKLSCCFFFKDKYLKKWGKTLNNQISCMPSFQDPSLFPKLESLQKKRWWSTKSTVILCNMSSLLFPSILEPTRAAVLLLFGSWDHLFVSIDWLWRTIKPIC